MLQDFAVQVNQPGGDAAAAGGLMAMMAGFFVIWLIVMLGLYVYISFAFMNIGKKAKDSMYGLAWIPSLGPALIAFRASGMHWWPWLLLIGAVIPFLNFLAMPAFMVFAIIWMWKMFEKLGRPGWWAILMLVPIVNLVIPGLAAWTDPK